MMNFFGVPLPAPTPALSSSSTTDELLECVRLLRPQSSPFRLRRYGAKGDGGYLLPADLDGITDCFSPGVENRKDFEDALLSQHGISSHLCDASSDPANFLTPLDPTRQTFHKKWLDITGDESCISLDAWVADRASPKGDLILQMDIEGAEYRNLLNTSEETLRRFRVLVIEFHGLNRLIETSVLQKVIRPLLQKIERDFTSVHVHPNNCCPAISTGDGRTAIPSVLEITFLRKDRFELEKNRYDVSLPHFSDRTCVVGQKPIFLNGDWLPLGARSASANTRVAIDTTQYLMHRVRRLLPYVARRCAKMFGADSH